MRSDNPKSSKSTTSFLSLSRWLAPTTAVITIDPKHEMYGPTAHLFDGAFRLDLVCTDLWNSLPECAGDREFARVLAASALGLAANLGGAR